jgi:cobalt-zinc-cadmium resistance protein CzcA
MRFNELLAGVRGDIAVKIFGDEFDPLLRAANQAAGILRGVAGAADVRVEQIAGLPVLEIAPDKAEIARRGLSLSTVQEVIGAAVGGREAGAVYEGDRHFDIVVRQPARSASAQRRRTAGRQHPAEPGRAFSRDGRGEPD